MNFKRKILALAGAAALVAVGGAAYAAGPYTVTAGSTSSGTVAYTGTTSGASPQIKFSTPGVDMTCASGTAAGNLHLGANATGANIASIDSTTWTNCIGPLGLDLVVTQVGTWTLNATGDASVDPVAGSITSVNAHVENPGGACSFDVTGTMGGTFSEATQTLAVTPAGSTLVVTNVSGCFGLVSENDPATFEMSYLIANPAGPVAIS